MSFVRAPNPIWFFVDANGQPLNDEYFAFFLTNTLPYLPQPAYKDNQGVNPWADPLQLLDNGTLPDNLYFDPTLVYRIEIRQGTSQFDTLIDEINDFVPPSGGNTPVNTGTVTTDNQISNPQFSQISFSSPLSISSAGTYEIAPGWVLVLAGTGTATISQDILTANADAINKPPYALKFDLNDWSSAYIYQRFSGNGGIWTSTTDQDGAVTASVTAMAENVDEPLSINYVPQSPGVPQPIASDIVGTGAYQVVAGAIALPVSINTNLNNVSYVDIQIVLPPTGTIHLSNVQVIGEQEPLTLVYQQETIERQVDHLFNVYENSIVNLPKADLAVGWNFSLNPFQFITTALTTVANQTQYIADQTILHQETAGSIQSGKSAAGERYCLELKALTGVGGSANRVALIQYIDAASILPYWGYVLSIMVRAALATSHSTAIKLKARLIWRTSAPSAISNTEPIASWPSGQDPTFGAGWTAIAPLNDPSFSLTAENSNTTFNQIAFDNFQLPPNTNATQYLGIVIYSVGNLDNTSTSEDSILWDKISLVNNEFAIDPPPKSADVTLRECQFYYEKSYNQGVVPGTNTTAAIRLAEQLADFAAPGTTPVDLVARSFNLVFNTLKRAASPTVHLYSEDGTIDNVEGFISNGGALSTGSNIAITNWGELYLSQKSVCYIPNNINPLKTLVQAASLPEAYVLYHYVVDARLGV